MFQPDLIVRSQRVVAQGAIRPASIHVRGGKIVGVLGFGDVPAGCPIDDADPAAVIPGGVDTHVHVNDSCGAGNGLELTTRAAAAGGITTIITMPPDRPAAHEPAAIDGHCYVDAGLWLGVPRGNADYGPAPSHTESRCTEKRHSHRGHGALQ